MKRKTSAIRRNRLIKIVATLGPASSTPERIRELFMAGADVFRLNFSHGKHEEHQARYVAIRSLEEETGRPICVMADLQGPKLRVGTFRDGSIDLRPGMSLRLDLDRTPGDSARVCLPHPEIFEALVPGAELLMDDGRIRVRVAHCGRDYADTVVVTGTKLSDRKGVNVPNLVLPLSPLTPKDRDDLRFALDLGVDWIALSFVQRPEDVAEARRLIAGRASLLVKLEKPSAIEHLEELVDMADGLMVARGDLGVEMPAEDVPSLQKRIIREARIAGKPVIVATQMLESMIESPMPTRAEVSDVATAIYEGADAIMLSAESAAGAYPVEAVTMMNNVALSVESDPTYRSIIEASRTAVRTSVADGIVAAAREIAESSDIKAICCFSQSGTTVSLVARERPRVPIIALTPLIQTARRLCLTWGTHCVITEEQSRFKGAVIAAARAARAYGFALGDQIVVTAGVPFNVQGTTNILRVAPCDERLIYSVDPE